MERRTTYQALRLLPTIYDLSGRESGDCDFGDGGVGGGDDSDICDLSFVICDDVNE